MELNEAMGEIGALVFTQLSQSDLLARLRLFLRENQMKEAQKGTKGCIHICMYTYIYMAMCLEMESLHVFKVKMGTTFGAVLFLKVVQCVVFTGGFSLAQLG